MIKAVRPLAVILTLPVFLAACGGDSNPVNGSGTELEGGLEPATPDPAAPADIPADLAQNLVNATYDPGDAGDPNDDTLTVNMRSLDAGNVNAAFTREASLDVPGFAGFVQQEDPNNRIFVALAGESSDGTVRAIVSGDGGQFARFFQGGDFDSDGGVTLPATGNVTYTGTYAGVTNISGATPDLRQAPVPTGEAEPQQPRLTQGDVTLIVGFADDAINGAITNRQFADGGALTDVILAAGAIDRGTNTFSGQADMRPDGGGAPVAVGTYGGTFGGANGESIGGVVAIDEVFAPGAAAGDPLDQETGAFILER